jgi:sugar O-acyltransferase (sialic acid O-acetyltransferase NeuD family)
MVTKNLTILGKSDSVITMILDNLESNGVFPEIQIVNNLNLPVLAPFGNLNFKISIVPNIQSDEHFFLGVNKSNNKFLVNDHFQLEISRFINLIHKTAAISTTALIGKGCLINSLVSVAAFGKLGNFVSLNRNCSIGHHSELQDFVTVQPGANVAGFVSVGEKTIIGMGANILDGVSIGKNVVIGAGSLVNKNIPDNVVAYGVPCRLIRENK